MQNFSEKLQNIFETKGHGGNGPRRNAICAWVPELVIGARRMESLIRISYIFRVRAPVNPVLRIFPNFECLC